MSEPAYQLTEADWCAIAFAKAYAAEITVEHQAHWRKDGTSQPDISGEITSIKAKSFLTDGGSQTDIQYAEEWEGALRSAKRHTDLVRKANAAVKKLETENLPFQRKATNPIKPGKRTVVLSELLPKPSGS